MFFTVPHHIILCYKYQYTNSDFHFDRALNKTPKSNSQDLWSTQFKLTIEK